jgi:hypothetical protein
LAKSSPTISSDESSENDASDSKDEIATVPFKSKKRSDIKPEIAGDLDLKKLKRTEDDDHDGGDAKSEDSCENEMKFLAMLKVEKEHTKRMKNIVSNYF